MKLILQIVIITIVLLASGICSADSIVYNPTAKTITITGYSKMTPCDFEDIFNEDVLNGWGVIEQVSPYFYRTIGISFIVGNATKSGWFGDIDRVVEVWDMADMTGFIASPSGNGSCIFGRASSNTYQTGTKGCVFSFYSTGMVMDQRLFDNLDEIHFYNTHTYVKTPHVAMMVKVTGSNGSIWGSTFSNCYLTGAANNLSINNVKITDAFLGLWSFTTNGTSINVEIENCNGWIIGYSTSKESVLRNLKVTNSWNNLWMVSTTSNTLNHYLIDCDLPWHLAKAFYDSGNISVHRQYTFNLQTLSQAEITIKNNTSIVYHGFTDNVGLINEQTFTMGHYNKSGGSYINSHNPHNLEIKKPGYQTYTYTFNLTDTVDWSVSLEPDIFPIDETRSYTALGFLFVCLAGSMALIWFKKGDIK